MNILIWALSGAAALYLVLCLHHAWKVGQILFTTPPGYAPSENVKEGARALYHTDFEEFETWERESIAVKNGEYVIPGEYHPLPHPRGVAVAVHGFGQDRHIMVSYAKLLRDLGFSTVLFDQRRFGESKAAHNGFGYWERQDTAAVMDYVRERFGRETKIVLLGCSMGGMSVLGAHLFTEEADAVIADSSPARAVSILKPFYRQLFRLPNPLVRPVVAAMSRRIGCDITENEPVRAAASIRGPVLILHGGADDLVPVSCGEEIGRVLQNPLSRVEIFPGRSHCCCILDLERYTRVHGDFLDAAIGS